MFPEGFKLEIPAMEWPQIYILDREATEIGFLSFRARMFNEY
jgi:hypothetical protein